MKKIKTEVTKANLTMNFDTRDVIDVLVSEQEQNIEDQIQSLTSKLESVIKEAKQCDIEIEKYKKELVISKYSDKILTVSNTFKDIGLNATVRFEIIDGCDLPGRHRIVLSMNEEHKNRENIIVVALIITNKDFDRSTLESAVTFYLEFDYDKKLIGLKNKDEDLNKQMNQIKEKIRELETILTKTDRLTRKAKAAVTKKAISKDVNVFLDDFRKNNFQEVKLLQLESPEIKGKNERV